MSSMSYGFGCSQLVLGKDGFDNAVVIALNLESVFILAQTNLNRKVPRCQLEFVMQAGV